MDIIIQIREKLKNNVGLRHKKNFIHFFRSEIKQYGVKIPNTRKIAREFYRRQIKNLPKKRIFVLCEKLLKSGIFEEAIIAFSWAHRIKEQYTKDDFFVFEKWLNKYVDNWAKCDDFCGHSFGEMAFMFPGYLSRIKRGWLVSENMWMRRGACVILIYLIK